MRQDLLSTIRHVFGIVDRALSWWIAHTWPASRDTDTTPTTRTVLLLFLHFDLLLLLGCGGRRSAATASAGGGRHGDTTTATAEVLQLLLAGWPKHADADQAKGRSSRAPLTS